jgi:hypothetical protein
LLRPNAANAFQLLLEMPNAPVNFAAIHLKLSFAGTARSDSAAKLRHLPPATSQPGQHVFKLGQLDLELTFARAGMTSEDVKDQLGAVDDAHVELSLNVALL